jgi:hypothetical protein
MGLNVACDLILWLGLEIETPKSNQHSLQFEITLMWCLLLVLLIKYAYISFFLKNLNFETIAQIKLQMNYKNIYI